MTSAWILITTFVMNDYGNQSNRAEYVKKEYCVMQAKTEWQKFYASKLDEYGKLSVICVSKKNPYKLITIDCTKEGLCNV